MTARSSAGVRPGLRSTSIPRLRKISTAAGDNLSLINTFGISIPLLSRSQRRSDLGGGPIEPRKQRLNVSGFHGCARPETQAGRRVAIGPDVVGHAVLFQQ